MGASNPNGSKTLAMSENTDCFVGMVDDGLVLKENTSALGSHFNPSIFKSKSSVSLYRMTGDIA